MGHLLGGWYHYLYVRAGADDVFVLFEDARRRSDEKGGKYYYSC